MICSEGEDSSETYFKGIWPKNFVGFRIKDKTLKKNYFRSSFCFDFFMPSSTYAHFADCANAISVAKFRSVELTSTNDSFGYVGQIFNEPHQSFG